ncbi:IS30 family transposase [Psychromonas sp. Urea-02u-13]|uniref:IS30 family transposase n=1 Tax=Psychromonas sp. Urea-02u-13 TaxID=2058326 RepID=UPI000C343AF0|nr:IS30 family transposase [Psychromonas sp. Urea-02u-13]PKG37982.1 IS30 family transposase [Psychromonas sp. Urea-02u-13]
MKTYKQLTYELRCQIYALNKIGMSQNKIAQQLKISQSTISRELNRNTGKRGYRIKQAQSFADNRRLLSRKAIKMTSSLVALIDSKIQIEWSPEQVSGWLREDHNILISHEAIYLYIWSNKKRGGQLFQNLRRKGKAYQSRSKDKQAGRGFIRNRVSIDERPAVVDDKNRIGDWEIDLVIGKGHSGALVTIVERKTSFTVSMRVDDKSARSVTAATIALLQPFKDAVLTITADNGKEFAYHEVMTEHLSCGVYFADPYCSWQRGLNENTNGLLRQYWPKSTDFKKVSQSEVEDVIVRLNERPRKKLNYKTPANLMAEHLVAIAA